MTTTMRAWMLPTCQRLVAVSALLLVSATRETYAHRDARSTNCQGTFTVINPVPSACLDPIETDRPHKTDTPNTVDAGHWQAEVGFIELAMPAFGRLRKANGGILVNNYKLGLLNDLGFLRGLDIEIFHQVASWSFEENELSFGSSLLVRSKIKLTDGPVAATLVPVVLIPARTRDRLGGGGFVFLGAELPWALDLELNIGALVNRDADEVKGALAGVLTTAVTRELVGPLSAFFEVYNDRTLGPRPQWSASVDSGLILLLGRDFQLDAGAYVGVAGHLPALTPFLGLSGRL